MINAWTGYRTSLRSASWREVGYVTWLVGLGVGLASLPLVWVGVLLAVGLASLVLLVKPRLGLFLLVPLIPFSSLFEFSFGGVSVGLMEGLLAFMLVAWLLQMTSRRQIFIPHPPLLWPFLGFLAVIGLSWLVALSAGASLKETLKWLEMLALYLFVVAHVSRRNLGWIVAAILIAGLAQALLGLYQFIFKVGPEGFLLFGGRFLRAYGTFRQPNPYAGYLGLVLPLALSLAIWRLDERWASLRRLETAYPSGSGARGQRALGVLETAKTGDTLIPSTRRAPCLRSFIPSLRIWIGHLVRLLVPVALLAALLAALFASQSRGAWLGFLAAATITIVVRGGKAALWFALVVVAVAFFGSLGALDLLPATLVDRFSEALRLPLGGAEAVATLEITDANFATVERLAHWQTALDMWRDNLWLGVGFGNYAVIYPAYAIGRWLDPLGHAHNYLLNIGAETGLLGLLAYLAFWTWVVVLAGRAIVRSRRCHDRFQTALAAGFLGVVVHLQVHNFFDNLFVQGMYLHVAIILGLLTVIDRGEAISPDLRPYTFDKGVNINHE